MSADTNTVLLVLDEIRREIKVSVEDFAEMPIGEVFRRLQKREPYDTRKWTRGEVARIVDSRNGEAALEVLQYLDERGPRVVAWDEERVPAEMLCPSCGRDVGADAGGELGHSKSCIAMQCLENEGETRAERG